jgi:hypothetical protein
MKTPVRQARIPRHPEGRQRDPRGLRGSMMELLWWASNG